MPSGRTPAEAAERYGAPFIEAVRCIAHGTQTTSRERHYEIDQDYTIALNSGDPLRLRSSPRLYLSAGRRFRILRSETAAVRPFFVVTVGYWYQFLLDYGGELLAFHWTPEASASGQKTYPHLHLGAAMLSPAAPVDPGTFHKKHLPTGQISIASVVRFAIEELGVPPLRRNWIDILERGQRAFNGERRG